MNPQYSIWQTLIVPFLIGLLILSGYFVFKNNPELMNQESYYKSLTKKSTQPATERRVQSAQVSESAFSDVPAHSFGRLDHRLVEMSPENFRSIPLKSDQLDWIVAGEFIAIKENSIFQVTSLNGDLLWKFEPPEGEEFSQGSLQTLGSTVFLSTSKGKIFAFDFRTGDMIWFYRTPHNLFLSPMVSNDSIIAFIEDKPGQLWSALTLDARSGQFKKHFGPFDLPLSGQPVVRNNLLYYATQTGRLNALSLEKGKTEWMSEVSSSFLSGPSIINDRVYLANEDGFVIGFDLKNGKKIIEIELQANIFEKIKISDSPLAFTVDGDGHLLALSLSENQRKWRYQLNLSGKRHPFQLVRMSPQSLNKLSFVSSARDWTVWTTCSSTRICMFDVKEGRLLHRIDLKGKPVGEFKLFSNPDRLLVPVERAGSSLIVGFEVPPPPPPAATATVDK